MPQLSKVLKARDAWQNKAVTRANQLREMRKTQKRHKEKISELKRENKRLQEELDDKKNKSSAVKDASYTG